MFVCRNQKCLDLRTCPTGHFCYWTKCPGREGCLRGRSHGRSPRAALWSPDRWIQYIITRYSPHSHQMFEIMGFFSFHILPLKTRISGVRLQECLRESTSGWTRTVQADLSSVSVWVSISCTVAEWHKGAARLVCCGGKIKEYILYLWRCILCIVVLLYRCNLPFRKS